MKRRECIAGGLAVATAAMAGFASRAQAAGPVIRVANLDIGPFMPVAYVGKLAAQHGIDVRITGFRQGLEAAEAVSAGAADIAVGGVEAAVSAAAAGTPVEIIAGCTSGGIGWVARKGTNIKTIADLKGKKFAVIPGLHELVMDLVFARHGLTYSRAPGADVQVVFIDAPPALNTALRNGDVDAMSAPEPFPSLAVLGGYATRLPAPYDTPLGKVPRAIFARRAFVTKYPDAAQRFVTAYVASMKVFRDQPAVAEAFVLDDALRGVMKKQDWELARKNEWWDVAMSLPIVQAYIDAMLKYRMIRQPLHAAQLTDLAMLAKAKAATRW